MGRLIFTNTYANAEGPGYAFTIFVRFTLKYEYLIFGQRRVVADFMSDWTGIPGGLYLSGRESFVGVFAGAPRASAKLHERGTARGEMLFQDAERRKKFG